MMQNGGNDAALLKMLLMIYVEGLVIEPSVQLH